MNVTENKNEATETTATATAAKKKLPLWGKILLVVVIVLRTHSIQHGWFTWRALGLTVFAGLAFLYYCCDVRQIAKRLKRM